MLKNSLLLYMSFFFVIQAKFKNKRLKKKGCRSFMFTFYDNAQQQQQQEHIYFERSKSKRIEPN